MVVYLLKAYSIHIKALHIQCMAFNINLPINAINYIGIIIRDEKWDTDLKKIIFSDMPMQTY